MNKSQSVVHVHKNIVKQWHHGLLTEGTFVVLLHLSNSFKVSLKKKLLITVQADLLLIKVKNLFILENAEDGMANLQSKFQS